MHPYGLFMRATAWADPTLHARLWWNAQRQHDLTLRVVDECIALGDVTVDVGANIGLFSARMLQLAGRRGMVHAFEPNPVTLRRLRRLRGNLVVHNVALSDHEGTDVLRVPIIDGRLRSGLGSVGGLASRASLVSRDVPVSLATLDAALSSGERVSFIKCDVEGHELAVLRGARRVLSSSKPRVVIEIEQRHHDDDISRIFDYFAELSYDGFAITASSLLDLRRFDSSIHQALPPGPFIEIPGSDYVSNFLFVPDTLGLPDGLKSWLES